jgi:NarL family two-component system sensor histidine kinase YdfH
MKHAYKEDFYRWFLLLWIGLTYIESLAMLTLLHPVTTLLHPPHAVTLLSIMLLTLLMAFHALLHWLGLSLTIRRSWYPFYALVQGILVLVICTAFPISLYCALSLYLVLIVEAAVILERVRPVIIAAAGYLACFIPACAFNLPPDWRWDLSLLLLLIAPLGLFVTGYIFLYTQQARAHQQAQMLLRQLGEAHSQVTIYAMRIEELTRTTERQRLARELHDTLAQGLTG